ncbi:MAG: PP2C family protein-serine/threonine phosphatase [Anaerohalosphaeraceae bacterium]
MTALHPTDTNVSPPTTAGRTATLTFVSDHLSLTDTIRTRLSARHWSGRLINLGQFFDADPESFKPGAVLLDASDVHLIDWKRLDEKIRLLDQASIPVILLNWPVSMEFSHFRLGSKIRSSSMDEIWARIESAMCFAIVLAEIPQQEEQQRQLQEQLKIAGAVQRNFLPQTLPATDKVRFAHVYHPAEWVSGDIFDAARLDETNIGFYIADAVGHSVPAALLTMFLKHTAVLRETHGNQYHIFPPKEVLDHLNRQMIKQHLKGCLFATVCCCLLNTDTMKLSFARAGHPYPLLLRPGQDPQPLHSRGGLLGVFEEMEFEQVTVPVQSGDKILLYSDGVEPLIGEVNNGGKFRFTDLFLNLCDMPVMSMMSTMENAIASWRRTSSEADDITLLAVEIL